MWAPRTTWPACSRTPPVPYRPERRTGQQTPRRPPAAAMQALSAVVESEPSAQRLLETAVAAASASVAWLASVTAATVVRSGAPPVPAPTTTAGLPTSAAASGGRPPVVSAAEPAVIAAPVWADLTSASAPHHSGKTGCERATTTVPVPEKTAYRPAWTVPPTVSVVPAAGATVDPPGKSRFVAPSSVVLLPRR